jgi:hypothetical protein
VTNREVEGERGKGTEERRGEGSTEKEGRLGNGEREGAVVDDI